MKFYQHCNECETVWISMLLLLFFFFNVMPRSYSSNRVRALLAVDAFCRKNEYVRGESNNHIIRVSTWLKCLKFLLMTNCFFFFFFSHWCRMFWCVFFLLNKKKLLCLIYSCQQELMKKVNEWKRRGKDPSYFNVNAITD